MSKESAGDVEAGSRWFIRLPGASALITVNVVSVTAKTVVVVESDKVVSEPIRYCLDDVDFVERLA